jgi:Pentapeptide repeats (8 copies)
LIRQTAVAKTNRIMWMVCALLAGVVLGGVGVLVVRLRPYWVAKYRGEGADLRGAVLMHAPLAGANLQFADLRDADLRGADLTGVFLGGAELHGTDLRGAHLDHVTLAPAWEDVEAVKRHQPVVGGWIKSARYDTRTRWPAGFDPRAHGAILVK